MADKNPIRILAACGLLALSGCAGVDTAPQEPTRVLLTHDELKALLSTTRTVRIVTQGAKVIGVYGQDGTASVEWGTGSARGTWRLADNKFCSKYPGIRRGYETCYVFQKTGENRYSLFYADGGPEDGKLSGTWAVEK